MKAKQYIFATAHLDWIAEKCREVLKGQLCNSLHLTSISLENQLVPDMKMVT